MQRGKFITLEGTEGAGKTTVLNFIREYLHHAAIHAVWTREPGGTPLAERIRDFILHTQDTEAIDAETELLMVFAARAQHLQHTILPALETGKWVVCDRFVDASYAYQGGGRKIDENKIHLLDEWIVGKNYPDLTLLLDISPEQGFKRTASRVDGKDRIEQERLDFFERVRNAYLLRAQQNPERIKIIDASQSLAEVEKNIRLILDDFLKR